MIEKFKLGDEISTAEFHRKIDEMIDQINLLTIINEIPLGKDLSNFVFGTEEAIQNLHEKITKGECKRCKCLT